MPMWCLWHQLNMPRYPSHTAYFLAIILLTPTKYFQILDALYAQQTLTTSEEGKMKKKNDDESHESANEVQQFGYGFGWLRSGVFGRLFCDEIDGLIDLDDPEGTPISERNEKLRKFDETSFGVVLFLVINIAD